jgi:hypothetical protein
MKLKKIIKKKIDFYKNRMLRIDSVEKKPKKKVYKDK